MENVPQKKKVAEIIGRAPINVIRNTRTTTLTVDRTRTDYAFYDKLRNGKVKGYELASALIKPIENIRTSWVLGDAFDFQLAESDDRPQVTYTNDLLRRLAKTMHSSMMSVLKDLDSLGDQFAVLNSDGSFSFPSPDTVEAVYDPFDTRKLIRVTISSVLERLTVTDTYTATERVMVIRVNGSEPITMSDGIVIQPNTEYRMVYDNPLGEIPVVHFANNRSGNEVFGRSSFEPILWVMSEYHDLGYKSFDGTRIMGNPIPTWQGMKDIRETYEANSFPIDGVDENGQPNREIRFDDLSGIFVGEGGEFKFASPGVGFTKDIRDILKLLYLIMIEHLQIPESMIGGQMVAQALASTVEQMKSFYQMIVGRRVSIEGSFGDPALGAAPRDGILKMVYLWLRLRSLTDRQVVVEPVTLVWQPLSQADEKLVFEKTRFADQSGLTTKATTLSLLDLVDDPEGEVMRADEESQARMATLDPFGIDAEQAAAEPDETNELEPEPA